MEQTALEAALKRIEEGQANLIKDVNEQKTFILQHKERLDTIEKIAKTRTVDLPGVNDGDNKGKFSFQRAILAIAKKDFSKAPFEEDVFKESAKRALAAGVDSAGGYLVPAQYVAELIEVLRAKTVVFEMGARDMSGLTGSPVEIPKQTGGATGTFIGESEAITASDPTFGQLKMTPHQASAMTKISNRSLALSNPALEALVRDDLAKVLARLIDKAALRGDGASNFPIGIANTPGINAVVMGNPDGADVTYDKLVDIQTALDEDDALDGRLGWVFHPALRGKIAKLKDSQNRPLFQNFEGGGTQEQPARTLLGYPWKTTTQIPTNLTKGAGVSLTELYFGNWEELIVGSWGVLQLAATQEAGDSFEKNQTWVRIIQEVDMGVRHAVSFNVSNDVKTT